MKIRIKKYSPIYYMVIFLTLPFMKPELFNHIETLDTIFNIWRVIAFLFVCVGVCWKRLIDRCIFLLILLQSYLMLITIYKGGSVYELSVNAFCVCGLACVFCMVKINVTEFISAQLFCYELAIYSNLISIIISPKGELYQTIFVRHNYLLCYYNNLGKYFYPAIVFALIYRFYMNKKVRAYLLIGAVWVSTILVWSGGLLVGIFAMTVVLLFFLKKELIFNYGIYWGIQIVFFLVFIVYKINDSTVVQWLMETVLNKSSSFMQRRQLWEWTLNKITHRFFIGNGYLKGEIRALQSGQFWQVHAHNLILDTLYVGGIIYLFLFIAVIYAVGKKINKNKSHNIVQIISLGFLGWSLQSNVDPYVTCTLMSMFILAYNSDYIINEYNLKRERL